MQPYERVEDYSEPNKRAFKRRYEAKKKLKEATEVLKKDVEHVPLLRDTQLVEVYSLIQTIGCVVLALAEKELEG